jgi:hypothetical protein
MLVMLFIRNFQKIAFFYSADRTRTRASFDELPKIR